MSDKKARIPQIRFAGFTGDWEERKLGDVSEKVTEKNKNNIYIETLTNSAEFGIINQRDFFDKDISNEKNLNGYYVVRPDDFVYNPRISNFAPVGPIKRNKLGRTGVMSPLYYVFRTHNVDVKYLEKYFSSDGWQIFMKLNGDTGARADRFAIKDSVFREMPIPIPSIKEQTKIGVFFDNLDNLITLQLRQLDKLASVKKTMLEKMFPKDGANVPEIRFAGFTGAWEERKVGESGTFYYGHSCPKWSVTKDATTPCVRYGELYTKFGTKIDRIYSYTNMPSDKLKFSKGTEVLVPRVGEDPMDYNHCTWLSMANVAIGEMISVYDTAHNPLFTATMFNATLQKEFAQRVEGGTVTNLYYDKLKDIDVFFPNIEEQEKISSYFEKIDNLITLHQRELNALKTLKKSMLQHLFI